MHLVSGNDLNIFNKVRMYLQVTTLSDIMTLDGKEIDASTLYGRETTTCPNPSKSAYIWPYVPKPKNAEIALWRDTICKMLADDYKGHLNENRTADHNYMNNGTTKNQPIQSFNAGMHVGQRGDA